MSGPPTGGMGGPPMDANGNCLGGLVKCRMPGTPVDECVPAEACDGIGGTRTDGSSSGSTESCRPEGMGPNDPLPPGETFVMCDTPDGRKECMPDFACKEMTNAMNGAPSGMGGGMGGPGMGGPGGP